MAQDDLRERPSVVVALNLSEVLQWMPPDLRSKPSSVYNEILTDIVNMSIDDGSDEMQQRRQYFNKTIGFQEMDCICHTVEAELRDAVLDLKEEDLLKLTVMPSEPDIPGVMWVHMPNPLYVGREVGGSDADTCS